MMKANSSPPNIQSKCLSLGQKSCQCIVLGSVWALVVLLCANSLYAQPPVVNSPAAAPPASAATPPASNLPEVPNFDIDLGTEEFENFGEEGFQVEDDLSPATETTVTAIKVAVVAVIVLLVVFIVMKLLKRKPAGTS